MDRGLAIGVIRLFAAADYLLESSERARDGTLRETSSGASIHAPAPVRRAFLRMEIDEASTMLRRLGFEAGLPSPTPTRSVPKEAGAAPRSLTHAAGD